MAVRKRCAFTLHFMITGRNTKESIYSAPPLHSSSSCLLYVASQDINLDKPFTFCSLVIQPAEIVCLASMPFQSIIDISVITTTALATAIISAVCLYSTGRKTDIRGYVSDRYLPID